MKVFVSSDWHFRPVPAVSDAEYPQNKKELDDKLKKELDDKLKKELDDKLNKVEPHLDFLKHQLDAGYRVVLAGDLLDTLEFGQEAYEGHPVLTRLREWTDDYPETLDILEGNHDRINPKNTVFLKAKKEVTITNILFRHGHQYDPFWSWFRPKRAPGFFRSLYRTPFEEKKKGLEKGELKDFHASTANIEVKAGKHCIKDKYRAVIIGHTHLPMTCNREWTIKVANCGDGTDSFSYLEIDTDTDPLVINMNIY